MRHRYEPPGQHPSGGWPRCCGAPIGPPHRVRRRRRSRSPKGAAYPAGVVLIAAAAADVRARASRRHGGLVHLRERHRQVASLPLLRRQAAVVIAVPAVTVRSGCWVRQPALTDEFRAPIRAWRAEVRARTRCRFGSCPPASSAGHWTARPACAPVLAGWFDRLAAAHRRPAPRARRRPAPAATYADTPAAVLLGALQGGTLLPTALEASATRRRTDTPGRARLTPPPDEATGSLPMPPGRHAPARHLVAPNSSFRSRCGICPRRIQVPRIEQLSGAGPDEGRSRRGRCCRRG